MEGGDQGVVVELKRLRSGRSAGLGGRSDVCGSNLLLRSRRR